MRPLVMMRLFADAGKLEAAFSVLSVRLRKELQRSIAYHIHIFLTIMAATLIPFVEL
jgi:hypothetical protein